MPAPLTSFLDPMGSGTYKTPFGELIFIPLQVLVARLLSERKSGAAILHEEFKSDLGLINSSGQQYNVSAAYSSFMRPLCKSVKVLFNHWH